MFIRVKRKEQGLHFTVVDIQRDDVTQELDIILDLGIIQHAQLNSEQAWYMIAENLIAADLAETEKCLLARDIASWLPPLTRAGLLASRQEDLRQLSALTADDAAITPAIPTELAENDPLTIIADWLEGS